MIITIDGPAASGKSSVAKRLAEKLHIYYLYTGLLYRAFAYLLVRHHQHGDHLSASGGFSMAVITDEDLCLIDLIVYDYCDGKPRITVDGVAITEHLYSQGISQFASFVSADQHVRERLLPVQRSVAVRYDIIADGRDCGTVVFPQADIKFYLTAAVDVRVQRIMNDSTRMIKDDEIRFEALKADLEMRDHRDQNRQIAPLKIPKDALVIDNSDLTLDQTVALFLRNIQDKTR
jgi:cytidylate kinase